ncbi:response regulator [Pedobacter sp. KR3-3]|uniref:Response regulator n=1 Tax=Pedobacter albus TaxID=3113905 RepID=A0ABU7I468_9SPHI|nr:response regulator [Pedobacter sp. KR3-3]MEE1944197.1 response regulator [Pedobacter sp. KR3-3]
MNVLLADQHQTVHVGLRSLIYSMWPNVSMKEASAINEVVALISDGDFDLAIIDISLPGGENLEELIGLLALETAIVVFSDNETDVNRIQKMLLVGAVQFLPPKTSLLEIRNRLEILFA